MSMGFPTAKCSRSVLQNQGSWWGGEFGVESYQGNWERGYVLCTFPSSASCSPTVGIWTKHLKGKTDLHQTVIDRCIKTLTQKQLIKAVKSVKVPQSFHHPITLG